MKKNAFVQRYLPRRIAVASLFAFLGSSSFLWAQTQSGTWSSTSDGLWSNTGNWLSGLVANGSSQTATFNSDLTGDVAVSLDSSRTIGSLVFGDPTPGTAGGWTINNNGSALNILTLAVSSGNPTITVNALGTGKVATISAQIAGTGGFAKAGTGTLVVTGTNSYTGATRLNGGTLQASDSTVYASSGTVTGGGLASGSVITLSSNTTLQLRANGANDATSQNLFFNNSLQVNSGTTGYTIDVNREGGTGTGKILRLGTSTIGTGVGTNTVLNVTGGNGYALSMGNLTLGGGNNTGGLTFNPTTASVTLANVTSSGGVAFSATKTLELGGTAAGNTVTGPISDGASTRTALSKTNSSTWTLSAANTYTGGTVVSAGTLILSGNGSLGTGNITIGSAAILDISGITGSSFIIGNTQTLNGDGSVNAAGKTLRVDGQFNPGSSPGDFDVTGNFTLGATAVSNFEIDGVTAGLYDSVQATGALTFGGTLNLATGYAVQLGDSVDLFDWGSTSGTFSSIAGTDLGGGLSWDTSNLYTTGIITAIPEPTAWSMMAVGGILLATVRRRRSIDVRTGSYTL